MTFEQFQATRTHCDDICKALNFDLGGENPEGNLYLGVLYIEHVNEAWPEEVQRDGQWHLLLGRDEWVTDDLEELELRLYDWQAFEAYTNDDSIDGLTAEYVAWNKAQGLDLGSADEHLHDESLTEKQRLWLSAFNTRWQATADRDRESPPPGIDPGDDE